MAVQSDYGWMDGWMDCNFYVFFNSISVISGRWTDDNEWMCAMESRLRLRRFRLERADYGDVGGKSGRECWQSNKT